ncbi:MAG: glycoside hydrolase family 32 protein [Verrucomicrobiota bacterium]
MTLPLKPAVALMLVSLGAFSALPAAAYREPWRPQFHFTPATNWMNDPNGMVYYEGEYHLFYQFNPFGAKWGHMSWGHAVSRDMVHWEHLPVALYEENNVMIFSGSAVVDWRNTSGFGTEGRPPLVAIYTGHYTKRPLQNQHLAFSTDRGRTWTKYAGNPVLDIGLRDFRDPKVMWHEPTAKWVMTVALPTERKVRFFASPNLKDWSPLSEFGPAGAVKGIWECPDLFPVPVEGGRRSRWVLIVNIGGGAIAGGSGCQYFVGDFDGTRFVLDPDQPAARQGAALLPQGRLLADFEGEDFGGWTARGDSFTRGPVKNFDRFSGHVGNGLATSWGSGDHDQGTLTSPPFLIDRSHLNFLIGGGNHPGETCLNLIVDGTVARTATGRNSGLLAWHSWDLAALRGKMAALQLVDRHSGVWGQVFVDHIVLGDGAFTHPGEPAGWVDYAKDFYAAVSWSDVPKRDGRRLWLGWMSNWQYANDVPTSPWRSAMSLPRSLALRSAGGQWLLVQTPVGELRQLREQRHVQRAKDLSGRMVVNETNGALTDRYELEAAFTPSADAVFTLDFRKGAGQTTAVRFDIAKGELTLDRTKSGRVDFHREFPTVSRAPVRLLGDRLKLRVFVDTSSIELFVNDGETVLTSLILPGPESRGLELNVEQGTLKRVTFDVWDLKPAWH